MKRLISFVLCVAMLVSMVVTAVSAAWGDSGVGSAITTADEATYAGNGNAYKFGSGNIGGIYQHRSCNVDGNGLKDRLDNLDFTWYNGIYFTSAGSSTGESYYGIGFYDDGLTLRYDFNRKLFYIQDSGSGFGWSSGYDASKVLDQESYDLPTNQWFNIGFHVSNTKAEILLNGEVIVSADVGYDSGAICYIYTQNVAGYLDNHRFEHKSTSQCTSSAHTFLSEYNQIFNYTTDTSSHPHMQLYSDAVSHVTDAPAGSCGMQNARDLIGTAYNVGTGVTEAQITAANNAWNALSPTQKSTLAGEGQTHLIAKANAYYYATNSTEAATAKNLINAIGTVSYPGSATAIANARSAYDTVMAYSYNTGYNNSVTENWIDSALSDVMSSYANTLTAAEERYAELEAADNTDQVAADAVIAKISAIGTVTYTDVSKAKIDAARSAYNALTPAQQALVTNYSTLTTAESTYANLKAEAEQAAANKAAADAVISKINAIGTVTYTDASKAKIDAARSAYNALTAAQKTLVTNYSTLTTAESTYANLKAEAEQAAADQAAADKVINKINQIGDVGYNNLTKNAIDDARTAYNALTADQQALVTNYSTLTEAETEYAKLATEAADQAAADVVIAEINALSATITLNDADAVASARASYNALTAAQKSLVTNYNTLTDAETRITELNAAKAAADAVVAKINAIGTVTLDSKAAIVDAENAYTALSDDAKAFVTNYSTLTTARSEYDALVKADNDAKVNDFVNRANIESADKTLANEQDIRDLLAEAETIKPLATGSLFPKFTQAYSKLNNALATIEDLKAAADVSKLNRVKATSLTISDSLAINYKITVDPAYEIVGMEFTLAGNNTVVTYYTTDANGYLVFKFDNIAPDMMAETITSVIIVKNGDGEVIRCEPAEYSIAKYANNKIATEGLTELLASMVNYGDAATAYTGTYTKPSTVIKDWSVYADSAVAVRDYTSIQSIGTEIDDPSVTWGSASLILSDSVDIRIKVEGAVGSGYVAKTVYGGEEVTFDVVTEYGESYFVWDIYNAAQMSSAVTFTIYDADGNIVSNSLTYSVESYVADMLAKTDDEKLVNLLTAIMQYGDAALAYKNAANG